MHIFLICPVRGASAEQNDAIAKYVASLEERGHDVHWPTRDTDQSDPVGTAICAENRRAIYDSEEIHVWYDPASTGSRFDLGMAFMLSYIDQSVKIRIANPEAVKATPHKSFENVLRALHEDALELDALEEYGNGLSD